MKLSSTLPDCILQLRVWVVKNRCSLGLFWWLAHVSEEDRHICTGAWHIWRAPQLLLCCEHPSAVMGFAQRASRKSKGAVGGEMVKKKVIVNLLRARMGII